MLNTTVLVAAHSRLTIPVSCVEQGRWAYASRRFSAGDSSLYASVRAGKAARVTLSLRSTGKHVSDQGEIWARLGMKAAAHGVDSPTEAMSDFYVRYAERVDAARAALAPRPARWAHSCSSASDGSASTSFPRPACSSALGRACVPATADEASVERRAPAPDPRAVLEGLAQAPAEEAPAVGLGREHRLAGESVAGAALIVEDTVAHLMAFPTKA